MPYRAAMVIVLVIVTSTAADNTRPASNEAPNLVSQRETTDVQRMAIGLAEQANAYGERMLWVNIAVAALTAILLFLGFLQWRLACKMNQATKEMLAFYVEPNVTLIEDGSEIKLDKHAGTRVTWKNSSPLPIHVDRKGIEIDWRPLDGFEELIGTLELVNPGFFHSDGTDAGHQVKSWPQDVHSRLHFPVQLRLSQGGDRDRLKRVLQGAKGATVSVILTLRFLYREKKDETRTARIDCVISPESLLGAN